MSPRAAALCLLGLATHASAVEIYLTADQGYPFLSPGPREVDVIGAPGPSGLVTLVGPAESAVLFNLWLDPMGETLSLFALRLRTLNGAVFTDWDISETLGGTAPPDAAAFGIVGAGFFTIATFDFDHRCIDVGSFGPGLQQGSCVIPSPANNVAADQTAPMLVGTLTMDLTAGGAPGVTLVEVVVGQFSSYVPGAGEPEVFLGPQVMLQAPEPPSFVLLGVGLAALATLRSRRAGHGGRYCI